MQHVCPDSSRRSTAKQGFADKVSFMQNDFINMSFPGNSFDAVYAIDATVHAPSIKGMYSQIYRVLKPGGTVGIYEWVMTDCYDDNNPDHRAIMLH